jgi:hypothetical protein
VEKNPARLAGVLDGEGRGKGLGATGARFGGSVGGKRRPVGGAPAPAVAAAADRAAARLDLTGAG